MSFLAQQTEIEAYMTANWSYTTIARQNVAFDYTNLSEWIRVSVLDGNTRQSSMSSPRSFRYFGIVVIEIFVAMDVGTGRALELADLASGLFRAIDIGSSVYETPVVTRRGSANGQWYQIDVDCPFYREEFES